VGHFESKSTDVAFQVPEQFCILSALATALPGQRCFVTEKGYMGVVPLKMQPGDSVYVLKRGRCPLVCAVALI
jgi:hypothetical protein